MFKVRILVGGTALLLNGDIAGVLIGCDPLPDGFRGFEQGLVISNTRYWLVPMLTVRSGVYVWSIYMTGHMLQNVSKNCTKTDTSGFVEYTKISRECF